MFTVQLPGSDRFDSPIQMHTGNQKEDVSLAKEFQHHLKKYYRKNGAIDEVKKSIERKCTERKYHAQDDATVKIKYAKMYCTKNKYPELSISGSHYKHYGARGLSKNYHLLFDPKLGTGVCAILRIPCAASIGLF